MVLYQIVMMFSFGIIGRKGTNFKEPLPPSSLCPLYTGCRKHFATEFSLLPTE